MGVTKDNLMEVMTTLELNHLKALMRDSCMRWLELLMDIGLSLELKLGLKLDRGVWQSAT